MIQYLGNVMKKIWLFSSYNWQGNPKALFLYMTSHCQDTHECWWLTENNSETKTLKSLGIQNILSEKDRKYNFLIENCDVYVTENFREKYPDNFPNHTKIFNTWHGVGLKHIELGLNENSVLADSIVRKYVKNYARYKNQTYFLVTSELMEKHFIEDTVVDSSKMIHGPYPRNLVYQYIQSYDINKIFQKRNFNNIILFAPTYRIEKTNGVLHSLIPDFEKIHNLTQQNNDLFIVKVHPLMKEDPYFIEMQNHYKNVSNIIFWDDLYDIYEIFHLIDIAVIDYSSIFYDLLEANVKKFIRYIPDFSEYTQSLDLIGNYYELTTGIICYNFDHLLSALSSNISITEDRETLLNHFFAYSGQKTLDDLIKEIDSIVVENKSYKQLHSFDVFDTLIRRTTLSAYSIFAFMQKQILISEYEFPQIFKDNWIHIRHKVEIDVRDMFKKTMFERGTDKLEITLDLIYERLQKNYQLSNQQIQYLKSLEIDTEINHVEPIKNRIDYLFALQESGHDVILISDMYLPETVISTMLNKADSRLITLPLYLSSTIGHQKSTGKLYKHIFFEKKYQYEKWVHYGDNAHADGKMPRRLGIETRVHQIDSFIPFESKLIEKSSHSYRYEAYQLATSMQRYRCKLLCENPKASNEEIEKAYYAYAYAGTLLVPYVHWTILDALKRGYETLYFISRDGHYLKLIADELIKLNNYSIQTKFIYGSRKAWRLPSYINDIDAEMFGPFGNFVGMDCFDDLVRASYLSETELLELFPEFKSLKSARHLRGQIAENIRLTLSKSSVYREKVLKIASEKRFLVRKYLQKNIDFNEKFAFVEFWGRGYTQDVFSRLLADASGKHIITPFYYCRSFSQDSALTPRHNFILAPINFSYFEPIFSTTPYQSIQDYQIIKNNVEAIIINQPNEYFEYFETGLINFVKQYSSINIIDKISFAYMLVEYSCNYQLTEKSDQFICNVFSKLLYNESSFSSAKEYAPILTIEDLKGIQDKKDLDKITNSPALSLARSSNEVRKYYQQIFKKMKLPAVPFQGVQHLYPINDLNQYIRPTQFPINIVSIKNNAVFLDISLIKESKSKIKSLYQCEIFAVTSIEWTKNGVPRLVTPYGYVTAHRDWVLPLNEAEGIYVRKNALGKYEGIEQPQEEKNELFARLINLIERPFKTIHKDADLEHIERKWSKFTRNPYQFFADAKNDKLVNIKYLFDEKKMIGRKLSRWVRHNL